MQAKPPGAEDTAISPTVFIVDDDKAVRDSLKWLISCVGLHVEAYASAQDFKSVCDPERPGCVLMDVRMPGMSGLELQKELQARTICPPVIIITGHGDVQMAVRAMKDGAFDFIEKPFNDQTLLDLVQRAVDKSLETVERYEAQKEVLKSLDTLTPREREVLSLIVSGETNKGIAHLLEISDKTVEAHRARVMEKLHATSFADLMKKVVVLEDYRTPPQTEPNAAKA